MSGVLAECRVPQQMRVDQVIEQCFRGLVRQIGERRHRVGVETAARVQPENPEQPLVRWGQVGVREGEGRADAAILNREFVQPRRFDLQPSGQ